MMLWWVEVYYTFIRSFIINHCAAGPVCIRLEIINNVCTGGLVFIGPKPSVDLILTSLYYFLTFSGLFVFFSYLHRFCRAHRMFLYADGIFNYDRWKPTRYAVKSPIWIAPNRKKKKNVSRLVFQFIQARCYSDNEDIGGAGPTGDAPTTCRWSAILLPTKVPIILEVWRGLNFSGWISGLLPD